MVVDAQLRALIEQAGRNLETLELLSRTRDGSGIDPTWVDRYRTRLQELQLAYQRETNELTRIVLQEAVERRQTTDRRRVVDRRPSRNP
jgi:hypothetical protein